MLVLTLSSARLLLMLANPPRKLRSCTLSIKFKQFFLTSRCPEAKFLLPPTGHLESADKGGDIALKWSVWLLSGPPGVYWLLPVIVSWELPEMVLGLIADSCGCVKYRDQEGEACRLYQLHTFCSEELKELDLFTIIFTIITNLYRSLLKPTSSTFLEL